MFQLWLLDNLSVGLCLPLKYFHCCVCYLEYFLTFSNYKISRLILYISCLSQDHPFLQRVLALLLENDSGKKRCGQQVCLLCIIFTYRDLYWAKHEIIWVSPPLNHYHVDYPSLLSLFVCHLPFQEWETWLPQFTIYWIKSLIPVHM